MYSFSLKVALVAVNDVFVGNTFLLPNNALRRHHNLLSNGYNTCIRVILRDCNHVMTLYNTNAGNKNNCKTINGYNPLVLKWCNISFDSNTRNIAVHKYVNNTAAVATPFV